MKYDSLPRFLSEFASLTAAERALFLAAVRRINTAYGQRGDRPLPDWPASLRVRRMQDNPGVWEMTWSFAGPDGRATFDLQNVDGETVLRWRRIGDHGIYNDP